MKTLTLSLQASSLLMLISLLCISQGGTAKSVVRFKVEVGEVSSYYRNTTLRLPDDLDASTRKKLKTSIEKKLIIKIDKVLDNKNNVTLNAIEVTVDVNGIVAVTKVKGKNLPQDIVIAITKLIEKQDYSKFKMLYFWKYVIEF
jgi:hypothetical protein